MITSSQKLNTFKNLMVPFATGLYAYNQATQLSKENECGGILAYVSKPCQPDQVPQNRSFDGISFSKTFANILTKQPYYQCGIALNDQITQKVRTAKFISRGILQKEEVEELPNDPENSSDDDKKVDQLKLIDYGYKETAIIQPEEDCFFKLNNALESSEEFKGVKSNICVVHSRFAELRRYYKNAAQVEDLSTIPIDHAHPNIDNDHKIAVFHNGFVSNFNELKNEIQSQSRPVLCGKDLKSMTDSQLITSLIAEEFNQGISLKQAVKNVVG